MRSIHLVLIVAMAVVGVRAAGGSEPAGMVDVLEAAQQMPRDARPGEARPATPRELELQRKIADGSGAGAAGVELAGLQERRGALAEAEATLLGVNRREPSNGAASRALASLYIRGGRFERAIEILERAAALEPGSAEGQHLVGTYYFEKSRDPALGAADRLRYIERGIAAEDLALAVNPDLVEALVYKNLLLRVQATLETDPSRQQTLIASADALRDRALRMRKDAPPAQPAAGPAGMPAPPPPPPPPPPPAPGGLSGMLENEVYGRTSFTVAGGVPSPRKTKDVRPVYPPIAGTAGVRGVVVVEASVDERGRVGQARIVQSIPMLNQSAIDAIRQWEFEPARVNGAAVPVVITVTVDYPASR